MKRLNKARSFCVVVRLHRQSVHRQLHPARWNPDERDRPRLIAYFKLYYEGMKAVCGKDDDNTCEALSLYQQVKWTSLRESKQAIQDHFAFMFHCVNGEPEKYYNDAELLALINLTVSPDPIQ